ncbi:MAG: DUF4361 domain-containing protein [Parabacteroides sp.]|uniref:DUF4361 domain-containing protein n=1 Tax=Parabacteroides faecalis TaxID=2924040 RepID=A0ABT0C4X0_9BACT|nr:DUF4361 domain-containing protein [Parabacteroides faecalis]MCI7287751.1 DUF4361 domain-containing protein [Parabacteroides sp.]MDY5624080.1 DUF4361 domain-containing protein [Bacteroidales bacterium]MCJ2382058.1 DUF4361 domain-containing protein [Parabacteroides faecalis]MDD6952242.1 DUF4361 domain-containing protein [Parabacteroides sp.]MDD7561054.1 DUF4361 domain-containing protein [Parabacteroides sp.]
MKYNIKTTVALLGAGILLVGCNETDRFEKEQYEKIISALSETDYAFPVTHMMTGEPSIGYVSALLSGTTPDNEDIYVEFEKDTAALLNYNILNFDLDTTKYAKELGPDHYKISDYKAVIKAGDPLGTMSMEIIPEGLSPDSIYMIPLKIKSTSKYTVNEELKTVLYRVMLENEYASQEDQTTYFMKGSELKDDGTEIMIAAGKRVFPILKNEIRTTVYTRAYQEDAKYIKENSILITIHEDMSLSVRSCDPLCLEIEQVGGKSENYFGPDVMGVNRFNIHYKFRSRSFDAEAGTYGEWSEWKNIKENMKRQ